jgi:eukaryotic-like serine/threonine-protein kinase
VPIDPRDLLQQALGDRYVLQRELGRGGMATVYLAHDTKHDRPVAVKLLHADLAAALGPERFRREITLAARLQHPHILAVHDSGEGAPGQLWYTMPYVAGESLRSRLQRERQLPLHDALRIACEVAHALDYAHRQGVVHRDIKPENILLTPDGQALVADFGIARPLTPSPSTTLTEAGMAVGTAQYMSPEQATGERTIDGRSDVFSLSAVLYEMLVGEPPFTGPNTQAVVAKILSAPTPSARATRPAVPIAVDHTITKALDRTPADRFATAAEFAHALEAADREPLPLQPPTPPHTPRRPGVPVAALALGLGILMGGGLLFAWRSRGTGSTAPDGVRLAVLPFDNIGDTANVYFADGVTDAVRTKLTAVPGIAVIASNSSAQYRNTTKSPQQIGQELGVRYLLVGKVRSAKGRIEVAPELIDANSATDKWSASYDTTLTDVFQVQGAIATETATQLGLALGRRDRAQLDSAPTHNVDAYNAYVRGTELLSHTIGSDIAAKRQAIADFRQAVSLDPKFALAWARMGLVEARMGTVDTAYATQAHADIDRALALNPSLPAAHLALAAYDGNVLGNDHRAYEEDSLALALAPNDVEIMGSLSATLVAVGRLVDAAKVLERARTIDPRSVGVEVRLATVDYSVGDWDQAIAAANRALVLEPNHIDALLDLGLSLDGRGDPDSALAIWRHMLALDPTDPDAIAGIAILAIRKGDAAAARATLAAAPPGAPADQAMTLVGLSYPWVLDSAAADRFLNHPASYAGFTNSSDWIAARAFLCRLRGDSARFRATADTLLRVTDAALATDPGSLYFLMNHALAEAFLGHSNQAFTELTKADHQLQPGALTDASNLQYDLALVLLLSGDRQSAARALTTAMHLPGHQHTVAEVRIDPTWAPLHAVPAYQHLIAEDKPTT